MNQFSADIARLFAMADIPDFSRLPDVVDACAMFAKFFGSLNDYSEAARIQGFTWKKQKYAFLKPKRTIKMTFDENTYLILALRYKELLPQGGEDGSGDDIPFDVDSYLAAIDTGRIDTNYMNSRLEKFHKELRQEHVDQDQLQVTLDELDRSFATLTQEEQKYAYIFLHDVQSGNIINQVC